MHNSLQAWQSFVLRCQLVFKLVKPWQHICPNSNWCICHKHLIPVCSSGVHKHALLFHVTKSSQLSKDLRNGRWLLIFGLSHFSWVPYCSLLLIPYCFLNSNIKPSLKLILAFLLKCQMLYLPERISSRISSSTRLSDWLRYIGKYLYFPSASLLKSTDSWTNGFYPSAIGFNKKRSIWSLCQFLSWNTGVVQRALSLVLMWKTALQHWPWISFVHSPQNQW